ncbi:Helix-turn-helix transcriptional regulator, partial [Dysosmobacter welbionis]
AGAFLSAALAAATGEAGGDIPPQKAEDAACHQGQEGAAKRRADVEPHAGGGGEGGNQRRQQRPQGAHSG